MRAVVFAGAMLAMASPAGAQQAVDHSHLHDAAAVAQAPAQPPAGPRPRRQDNRPLHRLAAAGAEGRRSKCRGTTPFRRARPITPSAP